MKPKIGVCHQKPAISLMLVLTYFKELFSILSVSELDVIILAQTRSVVRKEAACARGEGVVTIKLDKDITRNGKEFSR